VRRQERQPGSKKGLLVGIVALILAVVVVSVWYNAVIKKKELEDHYHQRFAEVTEQLDQQIQAANVTSSVDHLNEIINHTRDTVFRRWEVFVPEASAAGMDIAIWKKRFRDISGHWQEVVEAKRQELAVNTHVEREPQFSTLYINPIPDDAAIRFLNLDAPFQQGMQLDGGRYHFEVSAKGYEAFDSWVDLEPGEEKRLEVQLEKAAVDQPKPIKESEKMISNSIGMKFVYIPPGTFIMGSPKNEPGRSDDETQHEVTLTRGFYIQTTEVTQEQWERVMDNNPAIFKDCGENCPVEYVSWHDVQRFIEKLNTKESTKRYRLPTEAEWEYACRAGTQTAFSFGNDKDTLSDYGWHRFNSRKPTHPVGWKEPNLWGLHDMHGNVAEWCQDSYDDYPSQNVTDPTRPSEGYGRVLRGGSCNDFAENCRAAFRNSIGPGFELNHVGFRLVCLPGQ
jgi:formylglycine-generating enzyme required for sulfatase activity